MQQEIPDSAIVSLWRLIEAAQGGNTDQGRVCANFLLAWWNASSCGGFDLAELWQLDVELRIDCLAVFELILELEHHPLDYTPEFQLLIDTWRPSL